VKIALVVPGGVDRTGEERVIPLLLWTIERLARDAEVHVFALHQEPRPGQWSLFGATVHNAGRRPVIWRTISAMLAEHRRSPFDIVHAYWASGPGVAAAMFKALTGTPLVLTLPGGDLCAFRDIGYGGLLTLSGRARVKLALAAANRVVAPCQSIVAEAARFGVSARLVRFGVALDRWPVRAPRPRQPDAPLRLVQVADLNRVKDPSCLLRAMAALKARGLAFYLDQVGEDTLGGSIQRQAGDLGLWRHVAFHGHQGREQVCKLVEGADVMVISSRHETGPIAALEAAAVGVPTVGTAVGQIADWAPDAALVVPVGDAEALADAIERMAVDEGLRLRLAEAAQERAIAHDADTFVAQLRSIYREVARVPRR
jgi:glycosyltransferase involved in cell wall biosynthesis